MRPRGNWRAAAWRVLTSLLPPRATPSRHHPRDRLPGPGYRRRGSMGPGLTRRLAMGLAMLCIVVLGGGIGYYLIGGSRWGFGDCLFMTVTTITTVGFGELPGMEQVAYARMFTVVLLIFGTGSIVYFASTMTAVIIEGDLRSALFASRLKKRMKRMKDHVVVCGA